MWCQNGACSLFVPIHFIGMADGECSLCVPLHSMNTLLLEGLVATTCCNCQIEFMYAILMLAFHIHLTMCWWHARCVLYRMRALSP
jgi:hypothetical protein